MADPEAKRKKSYTKSELLQKLEKNEFDVKKAVDDVLEEVTPFNINDENITLFEDRIERLERVSKLLAAKCYKLKSDVKARKFRKNPELLDEEVFRSSQYSVLQSDSENSETPSQSQTKEEIESVVRYRKKPLNQSMAKFSRRRRVSEKRERLAEWAQEEGVTVTQLCGYFQYLENWISDKKTATVG